MTRIKKNKKIHTNVAQITPRNYEIIPKSDVIAPKTGGANDASQTSTQIRRRPSVGKCISSNINAMTTKELVDAIINLSEAKLSGTKLNTPGRVYSGVTRFLSPNDAEYLYLTNCYVARGIDTESEAIIRNGWSVTANNPEDQDAIDLILKSTNFISLIKDLNTYIELYGQPMIEMFQDSALKTTRFDILPPTEMDYIKDNREYIAFDKTGEPVGYKQTREGIIIHEWKGNDAKRIVVFKYRTIGGYIVGIPGIQALLYPANQYGNIRESIADSFIRSLSVYHVTAKDATEDDIKNIAKQLGDKITASTVYATDDRFTFQSISAPNDVDISKFIDPTLGEIAACFHMPIEMIAATQFLKGDDFPDRYKEWVEHIKMKQQILAETFKQKVFDVIFPDGVEVKFNSPTSNETNDLIKVVAFAVQSKAITSEQALDILNRNQVFGSYVLGDVDSNNDVGGENDGVRNGKQEQSKRQEKVTNDTKADNVAGT